MPYNQNNQFVEFIPNYDREFLFVRKDGQEFVVKQTAAVVMYNNRAFKYVGEVVSEPYYEEVKTMKPIVRVRQVELTKIDGTKEIQERESTDLVEVTENVRKSKTTLRTDSNPFEGVNMQDDTIVSKQDMSYGSISSISNSWGGAK